MTSHPTQRYYAACAGTWCAPLDLRITDAVALRRSGMGWLDRVTLHLLSRWPTWAGRPFLHTTVALQPDGRVLHTTVLHWFGVVCLQSVERIALGPDGCTFTLEGTQRVGPFAVASRPVTGEGEVNADATSARYTLRFLGAPLLQTTTREADLVVLTQQGPGWEGVQRLQRAPSSREEERPAAHRAHVT